MSKLQFKVLFREFLFRVVDLELLTPQGDMLKLLGQFAALLIAISLGLGFSVLIVSNNSNPFDLSLFSWVEEHFLISTTMLVVGLFAVLSWDSAFPDRRDIVVLAPLPVRARTLFLAKVTAVATALGLTVVAFNFFTGIAAPLVFASAPVVPPPSYDPAIAPVDPAGMQGVLDRDLTRALTLPDGAFASGTNAGASIGVLKHGVKRVLAYGTAKPDSIYEIGSISKTFTGLLLARMVVEEKATLDEPVRELLPPDTVSKPEGKEITLLDLITHHSGLPRMPGNFHPANFLNPYADYRAEDLYAYMAKRGVAKPSRTGFLYSNLGVGLLGQALSNRAATTYPNLVKQEITGPLGMNDTAASWAPEQADRLLQSYNARHQTLPPWDLHALAGAGAIRSTSDDMLTYLQAQLHPEALASRDSRLHALATALAQSHELWADADDHTRIAFAWIFDPATGTYWHNGGIAGYTSYAFFNPKGDYAGVSVFNTRNPPGFADLLGEHIRERLAGLPAVSLINPMVAGSGSALSVIRSFASYWITMLGCGLFMFCSVLGVQGLAQLLPRQKFLRVSSFLQMAFFVLLLTVYFLQPGFTEMDALTENQTLVTWIPSYWFFGLFQQLNGPIRPEIALLAHRAWLGLAISCSSAAAAYLICYFRALRMIAEQPDILPSRRGLQWLPRFGGPLETALGQFSLRTLLRSRQHRVLLSFYLGAGIGLAMFFSKAPVLREQGPAGDAWYHVNAQLMVGSILMMCAAIVGTRVVFSVPLELRANWVFRVLPLPGVTGCLAAIRRSLYLLAVGPTWTILAVVLFWLWPWRAAAEHVILLALLSVIVAEISLHGFQKIPFTCSYLPGKSHIHMATLAFVGLMFLTIKGAELERTAFDSPPLYASIAGVLAVAAAVARWRTTAQAISEESMVQFEDLEVPAIQVLGLHRDGGLPIEPARI